MSHSTIIRGACLLIGLLAIAGLAGAAELKSETLRGFEQYVQRTEQRIQSELQSGKTFLWVDSLPATRRAQASTSCGAVKWSLSGSRPAQPTAVSQRPAP